MPVVARKNNAPANQAIVYTLDNANATYVVVGNNATSNISSANVTVKSASITKVIYGAQTGANWTISRGSNVVGTYIGSGWVDYASMGMPLTKDAIGTLVVTLNGGTVGTIYVEIKADVDGGTP